MNKKIIAVVITALISFLLYTSYYYFFLLRISLDKMQNYSSYYYSFIGSIVFAFVGIPVGFLLTWILNDKTKLDIKKKTIINGLFIFIWIKLFSFLSLSGVILGLILATKFEEKKR